MSVTCQVTSVTQTPLQGMLVSLECLNHPRYRFESLTDEEGKITTWYSPREGWVFSGSFSHIVQSDDFEWRLCFEIYRFTPERSPIPSIPVTFFINREFQRDIQLVLDASQPGSYFVSIENLPIHSETRGVGVATDSLYDPAASQNGASRPPPTQEDLDDMWQSELISEAYTASPAQQSNIGASSSRTSESAAPSAWVDVHSSAIKSEDTVDNEQEESPRAYIRRLLSWTPPIPSPQTDVCAGDSGSQMKRKAVDVGASTDDSQTQPKPPTKRRRTNTGSATRRSQRLKLRQMEKSGDYVPLE